jgi:hypothetical protein
MLLAASGAGYGLTTVGDNDYLTISDRGKAILSSEYHARRRAELEALFSTPLFEAFVAKYSNRPLPIDQIAVDYLKGEYSLNDTDAQSCWTVLKQNLTDYELLEKTSGKNTVMPKAVAYSGLTDGQQDTLHDPGPSDSSFKGPQKSQDESEKPRDDSSIIQPQFHFNIQVHLPSDADPTTYDAIFRSIGKNLLGRSAEE